MTVMAYTKPADQSIHLSPGITSENFDRLFGHELVHVILLQKYKAAIPKWLDEGLACLLSDPSFKVDYKYLATKPITDVRSLVHPFQSGTGDRARFHYHASTALAQMLKAKCGIDDLLQLSVGKSVERYLPTLCGISDLSAEYRRWVNARK